jgi:hypothetical protein
MAGLNANWNGVVCSLKYKKFTFHPSNSTTGPFLFFSLQTIAQLCFIKTKKMNYVTNNYLFNPKFGSCFAPNFILKPKICLQN